jgi:transcriptional regulator with XRE-family HTH domain
MKRRNKMEQNEAMEETKMEIGGRIAELLEKRGMTQRTLAAEIGSTEVSVSRYIKNQRTPNGPMILAIAKALGVSCDYLLGKSEEPKDGLQPCPFCGSSAEARMLYPTPFTKGMVAVFC